MRTEKRSAEKKTEQMSSMGNRDQVMFCTNTPVFSVDVTHHVSSERDGGLMAFVSHVNSGLKPQLCAARWEGCKLSLHEHKTLSGFIKFSIVSPLTQTHLIEFFSAGLTGELAPAAVCHHQQSVRFEFCAPSFNCQRRSENLASAFQSPISVGHFVFSTIWLARMCRKSVCNNEKDRRLLQGSVDGARAPPAVCLVFQSHSETGRTTSSLKP